MVNYWEPRCVKLSMTMDAMREDIDVLHFDAEGVLKEPSSKVVRALSERMSRHMSLARPLPRDKCQDLVTDRHNLGR